MKIIGSYVSPYVRKVLACLALKGLDYEIDPITPFYGNDEFERLSPLRRIPVLVDGDLTLCDSSVICAWLDEAYPRRPLLPAGANDRARARWLEEYADTRLGDVFIWGLFYPKFVHPIVWGEPGDAGPDREDPGGGSAARARLARGPAAGRAASCSAARSASPTSPSPPSSATAPMSASRWTATRWPRTAGFVERALAHPCFADLLPFEQVQLGHHPGRPAGGPARGGRAAHRRDDGDARAARGVMRL